MKKKEAEIRSMNRTFRLVICFIREYAGGSWCNASPRICVVNASYDKKLYSKNIYSFSKKIVEICTSYIGTIWEIKGPMSILAIDIKC